MIKSELVRRISDRNPQLYEREVERVVNTVLDGITTALARRERVELRGFGVFAVKVREAHTGRNPQTQTTVSVPEKANPFFKPGRPMRERLNR
jgi:integration host factor subunit beta